MNIFEKDKQYIAGTYNRFPVALTEGHGSIFTGSDGREYIDMGCGIGVTAFGACDPQWVSAVTAQLGRLQHTSNLYYSEPDVELAEMLCQRTGMSKVFFSNSGAEANECAIKAARKYACDRRGPGCSTIITLKNSFHGRTITTLSATGQDHYHELFRPMTPGFVHVSAGDLEELRQVASQVNPAGIMIECVQGEGGVIALDDEYVRGVAEFAAANDIILIVDEVQTGNGRTGELYAFMRFGIRPDVVTTAKGLGGGLPIGATMLGSKVADVFGFGDNGSTFGGNPVCCAGAVSILSRIDDALLSDVRAKADYIRSELEGAPGVVSVSGLGLMIGIETELPASQVVAECLEKGVLCLTAKNKVRLLPALNIPMPVLDKAVKIIKEACGGTAI